MVFCSMKLKKRSYIILLLLFPVIIKAQWTVLPFNTGYKNYGLSFINKDTGYVAGGIWTGPPSGPDSTMLFKTNDGGVSWQTIINRIGTPISQVTFVTSKIGFYREWQDNINKTIDGGLTETSILYTGGSSNLDRFQVLDSQQLLYSMANNVYYTSNGGASWTTKSITFYQTYPNGYNYVQFHDLKNGFVWGTIYNSIPTAHDELYLYKTTDSCQTLQLSYSMITPGIITSPSYIRMKFISATTALMTVDNLVLRTQDFGTTWDTLFIGPPSMLWQSMDAKNNIVVIGSNNGKILTSFDLGLTYQTTTIAASTVKITDICIADANGGTIYATCDNGRILKYKPTTANVSEVESSKIIIYPNPTPGILHLKFPNTKNKPMIIDIYDYRGLLVKSFNYDQPNILPENLNISELNNGSYILKIRTSSTVDYFKILKQ